MRETGDVLYESGHVIDVTVVTLGDELNGDHANGATTLTVGDAVDFDARSVILIDGVTYDVTAVDDDTNTLTISPGLAGAKDDGEIVDLWDPLYETVSSYKSVQVRVLSEDSNEDVVEAVLASHLVEKLEEGLRGARGESVLLELDGDEWRVVDVLGFGDPDGGIGSGTLFYQDHHEVSATGDQTVVLTFEPIVNSEHVYWNGIYQRAVNWSRSSQTVTIPDPDAVMEVGDLITVEYAYRPGYTASDVPGSAPPTLPPTGEPTLYAGLGTPGPSNTGTGDIWGDSDLSTYTTIYAVDNALGRDTATVPLPVDTTLGLDVSGLTVWVDLTLEGTFQVLDVSLNGSGEVLAGSEFFIRGAYTGPGGSVSVEMTVGDPGPLLVFMDAGNQVWLRVVIDANVAPLGVEYVVVREARVRFEFQEGG